MPAVTHCPLPSGALLGRYTGTGYVDCFTATVGRGVSHAEFVEAFYTGGIFKLERWILALMVARPSTDDEARQLAAGARADFAAWRVEDRAADQVLMCDMAGRTRSWLMVRAEGAATRLYFGSAVVRGKRQSDAKPGMGIAFRALLGFHKMYSRVLLGATHARLASSRDRRSP
jgi:hypothetical protein